MAVAAVSTPAYPCVGSIAKRKALTADKKAMHAEHADVVRLNDLPGPKSSSGAPMISRTGVCGH
jgi:hypothetical protein